MMRCVWRFLMLQYRKWASGALKWHPFYSCMMISRQYKLPISCSLYSFSKSSLKSQAIHLSLLNYSNLVTIYRQLISKDVRCTALCQCWPSDGVIGLALFTKMLKPLLLASVRGPRKSKSHSTQVLQWLQSTQVRGTRVATIHYMGWYCTPL